VWRFILQRLLSAIPTMWLVVTAAFFLLHAAPGGPFDSERRLLPEIQRAVEARYHLDEPLWRQYLRYLGSLAHGDLGPSYQYRDTSVNEIIAEGLPVDAGLGLAALALALLVGMPIGIAAALRRDGPLDHTLMSLAIFGISMPVFVVAPLLVLIFAVALHWLPAGDWVPGSPAHWIMPTVSLALPYIAYVARLMRASTIETLSSPFIRTARAKGLPTRTVALRHALRPSLLPLISFLGPAIAGLITGSIVVEEVFGLPGIGRYFVTGAFNRDYTLVVGVTIVYGVLIIGLNLLADLAYAWVDPRVRLQA
jgi:oligopeptide transport system permease protein